MKVRRKVYPLTWISTVPDSYLALPFHLIGISNQLPYFGTPWPVKCSAQPLTSSDTFRRTKLFASPPLGALKNCTQSVLKDWYFQYFIRHNWFQHIKYRCIRGKRKEGGVILRVQKSQHSDIAQKLQHWHVERNARQEIRETPGTRFSSKVTRRKRTTYGLYARRARHKWVQPSSNK